MTRNLLRKLLPTPVYVLLSELKSEIRINLSHRRGVSKFRAMDLRTDLKLNLGCGDQLKSGWINVDLTSNADFTMDLRKPLPFGDGSCSVVYSEHFLEHLGYPDEARLLVAEVFRVLQPGGVFRVGVPDTELAIRAYREGSASTYFQMIALRGFHPDWCTTRMEHLNCHFRYSQHRFAYDFETIEKVLEQSGFIEIGRRPFDPEFDGSDRSGLTLYVDALKPHG